MLSAMTGTDRDLRNAVNDLLKTIERLGSGAAAVGVATIFVQDGEAVSELESFEAVLAVLC